MARRCRPLRPARSEGGRHRCRRRSHGVHRRARRASSSVKPGPPAASPSPTRPASRPRSTSRTADLLRLRPRPSRPARRPPDRRPVTCPPRLWPRPSTSRPTSCRAGGWVSCSCTSATSSARWSRRSSSSSSGRHGGAAGVAGRRPQVPQDQEDPPGRRAPDDGARPAGRGRDPTPPLGRAHGVDRRRARHPDAVGASGRCGRRRPLQRRLGAAVQGRRRSRHRRAGCRVRLHRLRGRARGAVPDERRTGRRRAARGRAGRVRHVAGGRPRQAPAFEPAPDPANDELAGAVKKVTAALGDLFKPVNPAPAPRWPTPLPHSRRPKPKARRRTDRSSRRSTSAASSELAREAEERLGAEVEAWLEHEAWLTEQARDVEADAWACPHRLARTSSAPPPRAKAWLAHYQWLEDERRRCEATAWAEHQAWLAERHAAEANAA